MTSSLIKVELVEKENHPESDVEETPKSQTYQCPQCSSSFDCIPTLDNHLRYHTGENPFMCSTCHKSFVNESFLNLHVISRDECKDIDNSNVTEGKNSSDVVCKFCTKVFLTRYGLARHLRLHTGERPFKCVECEECFIDSGELSRHMISHDGETKLQCKTCNKICTSDNSLANHMLKHKGKNRYQCAVCGKLCRCKSHLDEHLRIHSRERPFKCSFCDVTYRYKSQLKEHTIAKHSALEPIVGGNVQTSALVECDECGALLSRPSLRHHKLLHTERRHSCEECDKSFVSKYRLMVHKRCHTGERPFVCQVPGCGKGLTTKDGLHRHMVIHEGKKNFNCGECGKDFFYLSNLNQHMRTHNESVKTRKFVCVSCKKGFTKKTLLKKHQEQPCVCIYIDHQKVKIEQHGNTNDVNTELYEDDDTHSFLVIDQDQTDKSDLYFPMENKIVAVKANDSVFFLNAKDVHATVQKEIYTDELQTFETQIEYNSEYNSDLKISNNVHSVTTSSDCHWVTSSKPVKVQSSINCYQTVSTDDSQEQLQATTFFNSVDNQTIELQHPNELILNKEDFSNLMTLAGVSSNTETTCSFPDDVMIVRYGEESVKIHTKKSLSGSSKGFEKQEYEFGNNDFVDDLQSEPVFKHKPNLHPELIEPNIKPVPNNLQLNVNHKPSVKVTDIIIKDQSCIKELANNNFTENICENTMQVLKSLHCLNCTEAFRYHYELEEHCVASHPGLDLYKCFDCDSTFETRRYLLRHLEEHRGNSCIECGVCHRMFVTPQKLLFHMTVHTGDKVKPFQCQYCNHRFMDATHLRDHIMVHSGNKPYVCNECGHKFIRKRELDTHVRIHTGELPFKCEVCDKSFRAASYLKNHMFNHGKSKPFPCSECDKGYIKRSKLKLHMLEHTGGKPYKCNEPGCGKDYSDKREFTHHQMRHRGEKPHQCPICSKSFLMRGNMLQHKKIHDK